MCKSRHASFCFSLTVIIKCHRHTIILLNAASSFPSWVWYFEIQAVCSQHWSWVSPSLWHLHNNLQNNPDWFKSQLSWGWEIGVSGFFFSIIRKWYRDLRQIWDIVPVWVSWMAFLYGWHINSSPEKKMSLWRKSLRIKSSFTFIFYSHQPSRPKSPSLHCTFGFSALFCFLFNSFWLLTHLSGWSLPTAWGWGVFNSAVLNPQLSSDSQSK